MSVESATTIDDLDTALPAADDVISEGDDHIRLIKTCLKNSFSGLTGAVTVTQTEINHLGGVTENINTSITNLQAESTKGQHTIWIPALAFTPDGTNAPEYAATELNSAFTVSTFAFDASTDESIYFVLHMPKSWDAGTLVCQALWTQTAGGAGNVVWAVQGTSLNDSEAFANSGTAVTVIDAAETADDLHISPEFTVTVGSGPTAEDLVALKMYRDADNGSDSYTSDALLIGLRIHYTTDEATDD